MHARILLIEDNPANLELMSYLLQAFGYAPSAAIDGAEGVAMARRDVPDLVICDVQLPVMDGLEVARHLKSDPVLRKIPIVAVTALAMVGDRDRILAAGFDGYIAKPISPETFVKQMEVYLPSNQHGRPPAAPIASGAGPEKPATRHSVLVVDNLAVNLDLARTILEAHGFEVFAAEGMAPALEILNERTVDLILSDVCMAGGSGYEFIQAVKSDSTRRAIPFVFITSTMLEEKDKAKGLALGAARFLTRPLEPLEFLTEIESCLRERS